MKGTAPPRSEPQRTANVARRALLLGGLTLALGAAVLGARALTAFPPDTKPEGAYLRIARNITLNDPASCFAYLEDRAQHAAFTLRDYRARASALVRTSYPEPERTKLLTTFQAEAEAADGLAVWLLVAKERGFVTRLRRDLSGIAKLEVVGDRATIETALGTRYTFRRRDNGIWGLTLFTAELEAEAERAARDFAVIEQAAADYAKGR